jgi:hypothetical protein
LGCPTEATDAVHAGQPDDPLAFHTRAHLGVVAVARVPDLLVTFGDCGEHGADVVDRQPVESDVAKVRHKVVADVPGVDAAGVLVCAGR